MVIKILDVQHLRSGTVLLFNDGTEEVNLKAFMLMYCYFLCCIFDGYLICMDGYLLFATDVQLRIAAGMWYTNVRFSGWMTWGEERWSVWKFENWMAVMVSCLHSYLYPVLPADVNATYF